MVMRTSKSGRVSAVLYDYKEIPCAQIHLYILSWYVIYQYTLGQYIMYWYILCANILCSRAL